MALLEIITVPDPRLKKRSQPVKAVDESVRRLMDDMLETMYEAPGIGLAAPQVGVLKRVIVLDVANRQKGELPRPFFLANPVIVEQRGMILWEEGCLSLPEHYSDVERAAWVRVSALDRAGEPVDIEAEGILGVCLQHEIDHLDGVLFVDHISRLKREMIIKKLKKIKSAKGN